MIHTSEGLVNAQPSAGDRPWVTGLAFTNADQVCHYRGKCGLEPKVFRKREFWGKAEACEQEPAQVCFSPDHLGTPAQHQPTHQHLTSQVDLEFAPPQGLTHCLLLPSSLLAPFQHDDG